MSINFQEEAFTALQKSIEELSKKINDNNEQINEHIAKNGNNQALIDRLKENQIDFKNEKMKLEDILYSYLPAKATANSTPTAKTDEKTRDGNEILMNKSISNANQHDFNNLLTYYDLKFNEVEYEEFAKIFQNVNRDRIINMKEIDEMKNVVPESEELLDYKERILEIRKKIGSETKHLILNLQDSKEGQQDFIGCLLEPYKLRIPLQTYSLNGKSDSLIRTPTVHSIFCGEHVVALIDFKTCATIHNGTIQGTFELIGASLQSRYPVLYIQTDMRDFYFIRIDEDLNNGETRLIQYRTFNTKEGYEIIQKWLWLDYICINKPSNFTTEKASYERIRHFVKKIKSRIELPDGLDNKCLSVFDAETIQNAYELYKNEAPICNSSRTGKVFKIGINDRFYALKVPNDFNDIAKNYKIKEELKQEAHIYQRLAYLERERELSDKQKHWPSLYYAGPLKLDGRKIEYAILTNYIDGNDVQRKEFASRVWENVYVKEKDMCLAALQRLNALGIKHCDARVPNFRIQNDRAIILDFGWAKEVKDILQLDENLIDNPQLTEFATDDISQSLQDVNI